MRSKSLGRWYISINIIFWTLSIVLFLSKTGRRIKSRNIIFVLKLCYIDLFNNHTEKYINWSSFILLDPIFYLASEWAVIENKSKNSVPSFTKSMNFIEGYAVT
jgi:hypothetical protein